jgi:phosphoribosyl-ATP pyrophosphohydrolase/phosphoribosyl-AMP cyclohydrolase
MNPVAAPWLHRVRYDENGLIACIVQERVTAEVLMIAWMNADSLARTLETGETWFWSRSRQGLWNKGATSGDRQRVYSLHLDCDGDALLAVVDQQGNGACHTGARTCFEAFDAENDPARPPRHVLAHLVQLVARRDAERPEGSYTTRLLVGGVDRAGKKVGEEATEVVIAAKNAVAGQGTAELAEESADLLYHLAVLWRTAGIDPSEVVAALERRMSG